MNPRDLVKGTPEAREYMARLRAMRGNPGKKDRPKKVFGYELTPELVPAREYIKTQRLGDYGADPIGGGMYRMVPSGDIVDEAERNRRLLGRGGNPPMLIIGNPKRKAIKRHRKNAALFGYVMGGGVGLPGNPNPAGRAYSVQWRGQAKLFHEKESALKFAQELRGRGESPRVFEVPYPNPVSGPADPDAVTELVLYIENDYALVGAPNSLGRALEANLVRKWYAGKYGREKAVKLWMYLMESGAKKYISEFGTSGAPIDSIFNKNTRLEAARQFRDYFEAKMRGGEFDPAWVRAIVPKKYQSKLPNPELQWASKTGRPQRRFPSTAKVWPSAGYQDFNIAAPGMEPRKVSSLSMSDPPFTLPNPRGAKRDPIESEAEKRGVRIVYLPVNMAWLVMWYDQRLAGPLNTRAEAVEYVKDLIRKGNPAVRSPWAVCTAAVGRKEKAKYERCVRKVKARMKRGGNPALPPEIANDPRFRKALKMYRRIHGNGSVEIRRVKVPGGVKYPKFLVSYGKAPHAVYDAPRGRSKRGKRIHHFAEGGGSQPWLVTAPGKRKFLAYLGGSFNAGDWIHR